jgi:hypothetical protein
LPRRTQVSQRIDARRRCRFGDLGLGRDESGHHVFGDGL